MIPTKYCGCTSSHPTPSNTAKLYLPPRNAIAYSSTCSRRAGVGLTLVPRHFAICVCSLAASAPPGKQKNLKRLWLAVCVKSSAYHREQLYPSPKWSRFKCRSTSRAFRHPCSLVPTAQSRQLNLLSSPSLRRSTRYACADPDPDPDARPRRSWWWSVPAPSSGPLVIVVRVVSACSDTPVAKISGRRAMAAASPPPDRQHSTITRMSGEYAGGGGGRRRIVRWMTLRRG